MDYLRLMGVQRWQLREAMPRASRRIVSDAAESPAQPCSLCHGNDVVGFVTERAHDHWLWLVADFVGSDGCSLGSQRGQLLSAMVRACGVVHSLTEPELQVVDCQQQRCVAWLSETLSKQSIGQVIVMGASLTGRLQKMSGLDCRVSEESRSLTHLNTIGCVVTLTPAELIHDPLAKRQAWSDLSMALQ